MRDFDARIRERLSGHAAQRPADAWDRFVRQVPPQGISDDPAFDAFLRQRLEHHQVHHTLAARQARWATLRRGLDLVRDRSRELWLSRALEALVLLLVCFYWGLPLPDTSAPKERPTPSCEPMARRSSPAMEPLVAIAPTPAQQGSPAGRPVSGQGGNLAPIVPTPPVFVAGGVLAETSRFDSSAAWSGSPDAYSETGSLDAQPDAHPSLVLEEEPTTWREEASMMPLLPDIAHLQVASDPRSALPRDGRLVFPRKRFKHRVSMAMQADLHAVMTPYDHILVKRGYDQWSTGFGVAMGYGWEGRRWALRAQLSYRHLYYLPKPYTEVFDGDLQRGYFTESIRNIELNMVSGGLQVSRHLFTRGRWRGYALAGGTMHLAVLANYDRKQRHIPGTDPLNPGELPVPQQTSRTSQKRFADGFFEGGSLEENYYLSLDFGAGMERHLNGRVSLFVEPVYHHNPFQKSLGPNRDRISTLSVFGGIRVLL